MSTFPPPPDFPYSQDYDIRSIELDPERERERVSTRESREAYLASPRPIRDLDEGWRVRYAKAREQLKEQERIHERLIVHTADVIRIREELSARLEELRVAVEQAEKVGIPQSIAAEYVELIRNAGQR